ncbi:DUF979 domain-containing protein [Fusobacterium sp.]|uniref:DUF979 domain-containing protein n=1 Tax=Fusobacterium sp. TaxID=68766 RepID=UPI002637DE10|nr:DUF979 domain-containing protein [Fusobacterium sp.]
MSKIIFEIMYVVCGIILISTGIYNLVDKNNPKRFGSALFWTITGVIFIAGPYMNKTLVGGLLVVLGILTVTKNIKMGNLVNSSEEYRTEKSEKIGNKIFIPALSIGVVAFSVAQFTELGGLVGLGFGALVSLILTLMTTKENPKYISYDSSRILQQMGPNVILPQLLGALGVLFSTAGVGEVIAQMMEGVIPADSKFFGVVGYCVAMALFTMIMGNAFAAFAVITTGIGIPFVVHLGANPAVVGALGITAGYCGTLMTPMAANFNIIPASILEMENKNGVILVQAPIAITLLAIHILLMYTLAF